MEVIWTWDVAASKLIRVVNYVTVRGLGRPHDTFARIN